jgi:hypothetical protein
MPATYIQNQQTGESSYVFFPIKALLSEGEQALFELYRTSIPVASSNQRAVLEQEIMTRLEKLSILKDEKPTILDTNSQFLKIEQMCKDS